MAYDLTVNTDSTGAYRVEGCPPIVVATAYKRGLVPLLRQSDNSTAVARRILFSGRDATCDFDLAQVYVATMAVVVEGEERDKRLAKIWFGASSTYPRGLKDVTAQQATVLRRCVADYPVSQSDWRREYDRTYVFYRLMSRDALREERRQIHGGSFELLDPTGARACDPVKMLFVPVGSWEPSHAVVVTAKMPRLETGRLVVATRSSILVESADPSGRESVSAVGEPDELGLVSLDLPVGSYRVGPRHVFGDMGERGMRVSIDRHAESRVEYAPADFAGLTVRVRDAAGRPTSACSVRIAQARHGFGVILPREPGVYHIWVANGEYSLTLINASLNSVDSRTIVVSGSDADVVFDCRE